MNKTVAKGIFDALELLYLHAQDATKENEEENTKVQIALSIVHTALGVVTDFVPVPIISFREKDGEDDGV